MACPAPTVIAGKVTCLFICRDITERSSALTKHETTVSEFLFDNRPSLVAKNRIGPGDFLIFRKAPRVANLN